MQSSNPFKQAVIRLLWTLFLVFIGFFTLWTLFSLFFTVTASPPSLHPLRPLPRSVLGQNEQIHKDQIYDAELIHKQHGSRMSSSGNSLSGVVDDHASGVPADTQPWKPFVPCGATYNHGKKYAYASLLCDDAMLGPAQVVVYSMLQTGTPYPYLLLLLPSVSQNAEDSLKRLGATPIRISMLDYPFPVNAEKRAINKMCRYSKLHIWSKTDYDKIAFVDMDMLIMQNLDDVFEWPEFSAVKDAGDTYNTGLFVLQPSLTTYKDILQKYAASPSYNHGDQGFINWYFGGQNAASGPRPKSANPVLAERQDAELNHAVDSRKSLPIEYNVMVKHQRNGQWPEIKKNARIFHLTSETKPWTFYYMHHRLWKENFEPSIFYYWNREYNKVAEKLALDVYASAESPHSDANRDSKGHDDLRLRSVRYNYSNWMNLPRMAHFCERISIDYDPRSRYFISSKFSVLIHKFSTIETLELLLASFQGASFIDQVFVSWPFINPKSDTAEPLEFPEELRKYHNSSPETVFIRTTYPSANNKFAPINGLRTKALFLITDEVDIPKWYDLELAFAIWRSAANPWSLVGFRPYGALKIPDPILHTGRSSPLQADAKGAEPTYSIMCTNGLFIASEYLFIYTCLLPQSLHKYVDECRIDTSDLVLNLLAMGMASAPPIAVTPPVFNPKRWVPESPYEMPRKSRDGRVLGSLSKKKRNLLPSFTPMNFAFFSNRTALLPNGTLASTKLDEKNEELMSRLFFTMNAYVETAFNDLLEESQSGMYNTATANPGESNIPASYYSSDMDTLSLDNSRPLDVADDPATLGLKEIALREIAVKFFHFTDATLSWNFATMHGEPNSQDRRIRRTGPKGLFVKSNWIASRYEKIPFTKMSLSKWKTLQKSGHVDQEHGDFSFSKKPAFASIEHINLLQVTEDTNSTTRAAASAANKAPLSKVSSSVRTLWQPMSPPVPHLNRPFRKGQPIFDSRLLKA